MKNPPRSLTYIASIALCLFSQVEFAAGASSSSGTKPATGAVNGVSSAEKTPNSADKIETAIFAGGCFWCMESPFDKLSGVLSTTSGYTGGQANDANYKQVSAGGTGHLEAIEVKYDSKKIKYAQLLETFWHNIDPLDSEGQFCDKGSQYKSAIFYLNAEQKADAEKSLAKTKAALGAKLKSQPKPKSAHTSDPKHDPGNVHDPENVPETQPEITIRTQILEAKKFYPAEDYHQDYYKKNPVRYHYYRSRCGRDARLKQLWGL